jgi:hypothetical protein
VSLPATAAFNWSISTEGYAWMIGRPDGELDWPGVPAGAPVPFLVDQRVFRGANARPARRYRPLEDTPTLFLDFADTHANFSEIAGFVRRHGLLGGDIRADFVTSWKGKKVRLSGEPVAHWADSAADMRLAVELWAIAKGRVVSEACLLEESDTGEISLQLPAQSASQDASHSPVPLGEIEGLLAASGPTAVIEFWKRQIGRDATLGPAMPQHLLISSPDHHPERRASVLETGVAAAASMLVADMINEGLKGRAGPKISRIAAPDTGMQGFQFGLAPRSLLGAMWLQLASAADSGRNYERCSSCESWFEVAPGLGRPDKTYCSTACRMRAYRRRKTEAGAEVAA